MKDRGNELYTFSFRRSGKEIAIELPGGALFLMDGQSLKLQSPCCSAPLRRETEKRAVNGEPPTGPSSAAATATVAIYTCSKCGNDLGLDTDAKDIHSLALRSFELVNENQMMVDSGMAKLRKLVGYSCRDEVTIQLTAIALREFLQERWTTYAPFN